jgi:hypothetical protein
VAEGRVVDTNVLIVASAAHHGSPFPEDATPVEQADLRQRVLDWLSAFEIDSTRHAVWDWDWHICGEYQKKLTEQDYGWLAMMTKRDKNEVTWVGIQVDANGHGVLPPALTAGVSDLDDRKMVAAVLATPPDVHPCRLTVACDTDWLDCEPALTAAAIEIELILEDWLRAKWEEKRVPGS